MPTERDIWLACAKLAPKHPWYFLRCLRTTDEHYAAGPRAYPIKAVDRIICRAWLEFPLLFIEKSRQIMMTWRMAGLTLWDATHLYGRRHFFRSRKQEFADAKVEADSLIAGEQPDAGVQGQMQTTFENINGIMIPKYTMPDGTVVEIDGKKIVGRPENRIKKRVRRHW